MGSNNRMQRVSRLNIAHVVYSFDYGGLERRILRLIEALSPMGVTFHIISLRESDGAFLPVQENIKHHVLGARPGIDFRAVRRLAQYLSKHDIHIVHSHNWVSMLEGILAGNLARTPVTVHGEHGASRFAADQRRWRRTLTQQFLSRLADAIIPVNKSIRDLIVRHWRFPDTRVTVIPNGVDIIKFAPSDHDSNSRIVIGSISRLEQIKNFPCLIRAVAALNERANCPRYQLVIVGAGSERESLNALVDELDAEAFISLPGATENAETWYSRFDIYCNCSFSEGMSNTVLEAMACALPVVVSDVPGHREWLIDGENALFFDSDNDMSLANAIASLNEFDRMRIGHNNRELVIAQYNQDAFIEKYCDLYSRLLARKDLYFEFSVNAAGSPSDN